MPHLFRSGSRRSINSCVSGVEAAAIASAGASARQAGEASVSILKKVIDTATESATALIDAVTEPAALPPVNGVGTRVDVRI